MDMSIESFLRFFLMAKETKQRTTQHDDDDDKQAKENIYKNYPLLLLLLQIYIFCIDDVVQAHHFIECETRERRKRLNQIHLLFISN